MKKYITLLVFLLIGVSKIRAITDTTCVLKLDFNNNYIDSVSGKTVVASGTGFGTDRFGNSNGAVYFNGNSYVKVFDSIFNSAQNLFSSDVTVSFWFKSNQTKRQSMFAMNTGYSNNLNVELDGGVAMWAYWNSAGSNGINFGTSGLFTDSLWHHFLLSKSSDSVRLFIDGKKIAARSSALFEVSNTADLLLGAYDELNLNLYTFSGGMDEMYLYKRAFDSTNVTDLYNSQIYFTSISNSTYYFTDTVKTGLSKPINPTYVVRLQNTLTGTFYVMDTTLNIVGGKNIAIVHSSSLQCGPYKFVLLDDQSQIIATTKSFLLDSFPTLRFVYPISGKSETWSTYSSHRLVWTYYKSAKFDLRYSVDNGVSWKVIDSNYTSSTFEYVFKLPFFPSSTPLKFRIKTVLGPYSFTTLDSANTLIEFKDEVYYKWDSITLNANFPPADGVGGAFFNNKYRLLGGWNPFVYSSTNGTTNAMYSSVNAKTWTFEGNAPWMQRHTHGTLVYNSHLWIVGGDCNQGFLVNDVWKSSDGVNFNLVNATPPWANRVTSMFAVFNNKMWVFGGQRLSICNSLINDSTIYNDVWSSTDGINWLLETPNAGWSPRGQVEGYAVHNNKLWLMGGGTYDIRTYKNDVWNTADGVTWNKILEKAPWPERQYNEIGDFDGRIWVFDGYNQKLGGNLNDVWHSEDGINWFKMANVPWNPRHAATIIPSTDSLLLIAGNLWNDSWKLKKDTTCKNALAITSDTITIQYGDTIAAALVKYSGFKDNDDYRVLNLMPKVTNYKVDTLDIGTYSINLQGRYDNKYCVGNKTCILKVTKRNIRIVPNDTTVYYGDSVINYAYHVEGLSPYDSVQNVLQNTPTLTCAATTNSVIGNYPIYSSGVNLINNNYILIHDIGTLSIVPRILQITSNDTNFIYGSTFVSAGFSYSGNRPQDAVFTIIAAVPIDSLLFAVNNPVGVYTVYPSSVNIINPNYTFQLNPGQVSILPAILDVYAPDTNSIYGEIPVIPQQSITYSGFVNNDDLASAVQLAPFASTAANQFNSVGAYPITLSGGSSGNYTFVFHDGVLNIQAREMTIKPIDTTSIYGNTPVVLSYTVVGLVNGDALSSVVQGAVQLYTNANSLSPVGMYTIAVNTPVLSNPNYFFSGTTANLEVIKRALHITPLEDSSVYGSINFSFNYILQGLVNNDSAGLAFVPPVQLQTSALANSSIGVYLIFPLSTVVNNNNYALVYDTAQLTVTAANLQLTLRDTFSTYGDVPVMPVIEYLGLQNGDVPASVFSIAPQPVLSNTSSSGVGVYTTTISPGQQFINNYTISYVNGAYIINPRALTITANDTSIFYGMQPGGFNFNYTNLVNGDNPQTVLLQFPTPYTPATDTSAVGFYPILSSGAVANANYYILYDTGWLNIYNADLFVYAQDTTAVYGDSIFHKPLIYVGMSPNDSLTSVFGNAPQPFTSANSYSHVGTYTIQIQPGNLINPNYNVHYINAQLSITPASLQVVANDTAIIYGENINAALTYSLLGLKNDDNVDSVFSQLPLMNTPASQTLGVGTYPVQLSSGVAATSNYSITYIDATMQIDKATVYLDAPALSFEYGTSFTSNQTIQITGLQYNDQVGDLFSSYPYAITTANQYSPVGTYPLLIDTTTFFSNNYQMVVQNNQLSIYAADLYVQVADTSLYYGDNIVLPEITYIGFKNNDNVSNTFFNPSIVWVAANSSTSVGNYPINITLGSLIGNNYNLIPVGANLQILHAPLLVKVSDTNFVYGENVVLPNVTYTGFKLGHTASDVFTVLPFATTSATSISPVGVYTVNLQNGQQSNFNYAVTYEVDSVYIQQRTLQVTAPDTSIEYGEVVVLPALVYNGFVNGDLPSTALSAVPNNFVAVTQPSVGQYNIFIQNTSALNYAIQYQLGLLTITKAQLTVQPDTASGRYGDPIVLHGYHASGYKYADDSTVLSTQPILFTSASSLSAAGLYPISVSNQAAISAVNYDIQFADTNYTIYKRDCYVKAVDTAVNFGELLQNYPLQVDSMVNGDDINDIDVLPNAVCPADEYSIKGSYEIILSGGQDNNYNLILENGALEVKPTSPVLVLELLERLSDKAIVKVKIISSGGELYSLGILFDSTYIGDTTVTKIKSKQLDVLKLQAFGEYVDTITLPPLDQLFVRAYAANSMALALSNELQLVEKYENQVFIYPNPTSQYLLLNVTGQFKQGRYELYDVGGHKVKEGSLEGSLTRIDVSTLASGNYSIRFSNNANSLQLRTKFVKTP